MDDILLVLAVAAFGLAVLIDYPWPTGPTPRFKELGNFSCSLGFFLVTLYLYWHR